MFHSWDPSAAGEKSAPPSGGVGPHSPLRVRVHVHNGWPVGIPGVNFATAKQAIKQNSSNSLPPRATAACRREKPGCEHTGSEET